MCKFYNNSLRLGKIPEQWKSAEISAIFKKGDRRKPENYRPISLTSIICKIFESFVRDSVESYLTNNKLLTNRQFGFMKKNLQFCSC